MKLWSVTIETNVMVLAEAEREAVSIAKHDAHLAVYDMDVYAREIRGKADGIDGDDLDSPPFSANGVNDEEKTVRQILDEWDAATKEAARVAAFDALQVRLPMETTDAEGKK
jgi:hypothetical protein